MENPTKDQETTDSAAPKPWDCDVTLRVWATTDEAARDEAIRLLESAGAEFFYGFYAKEAEQ